MVEVHFHYYAGKIIVIILSAVALVGGQLPFGQPIGIIYPYTGYIGIIFLVIVAVKIYIVDCKK